MMKKEKRQLKTMSILLMLAFVLICSSTLFAEKAYAANRPGNFYVSSPSNNATYEDGNSVTVKWGSSSDAEYYIFIVNDETVGKHIVDTTTDSTSYSISSRYLTAGHKYKIFVQAKNDNPEARTADNTMKPQVRMV